MPMPMTTMRTTTPTPTTDDRRLVQRRTRGSIRPTTVNRDERTFEVLFTTGQIVDFGFNDRLAVQLSRRAAQTDWLNSGRAPFLRMHSRDLNLESTLGVIERGSVSVTSEGGTARVRLSRRADVDPIMADIEDGILQSVSMGFFVHEERTEEDDDGAQYRLATSWEPVEISLVDYPADRGARIQSCAAAECVVDESSPRATPQFDRGESAVVDQTDSQATDSPDDETVADVATLNPAADQPAPAATDAADLDEADESEDESESESDEVSPAETAGATAERARVNAIMRQCHAHNMGNAFIEQAISRGLTLEQVNTRILTQLRRSQPSSNRATTRSPTVPAQVRDNTRERQFGDAMRRGMVWQMANSPESQQTTIDPDNVGRDFRSQSIAGLMRHCLKFEGVNCDHMNDGHLYEAMMDRTARHGLRRQRGDRIDQAGGGQHSTSDFSNVLLDAMHVTLRMSYEATMRTFTIWARRSTATDFREMNRVLLGGAPDIEQVPEGGEISYGSMEDTRAKYRLFTYGRIIALTRQTLINDSLNAFGRIAQMFGASAADKESDLVYDMLNDNDDAPDGTDLFHANHGNLGTGSKITETGLTAMDLAFAKQKGLEGRPINLSAAYLLVPRGQRLVEARKLMTAITPDETSNVNVYANDYQIVTDIRLNPDSGNDPWYGVASTNRIDTIEYAYLAGFENPFTEARMGFEVEGLEIKCRHDFGSGIIDHRGFYKNPGA